METTPVYTKSAEYAHDHDEVEPFCRSWHQNSECRALIDRSIAAEFDGLHLDRSALDTVREAHTDDRIRLILAISVLDKLHDGRFSASNKQWAHEVTQDIPPDITKNLYATSRTHPYILNGFITMFRQATEKQEARK